MTSPLPALLSPRPRFRRFFGGDSGPRAQPARALATIFLAAILAWSAPAYAAPATVVDPGQNHGQWEGWGTSLCWWAKVFGDRDDLADLFFTTRTVSVLGQGLPSLGLTVVRYNAGACSPSDVHGQRMALSPKIPAHKRIEGFWLDGLNTDPRSPSWDWSVDANQRAMLLKARDRGANRYELFSNSPMWWMCANRNPSGDAAGGDNLPPANDEAFAVYLATVAKQAADQWGVTFTSVEPLNEPSANWWRADGKQEGCHFSREAQAAVVQRLRAELDRRGLRDLRVAASDENTYDEALETWNRFDARTRAAVGRINVHGYQKGGGRRDGLFKAADGKPLWNSEYGENDPTGLEMARNIGLDFRYLHPTAWTYWQALDGSGWGLLRSDLAAKTIQEVNPKFHVLAQYSRHIRPGMTILDTGEAETVAAYDAPARKLVLVTLNEGQEGAKSFDLGKFAGATGPVTRWTTVPRGTARHEVHPGPAVADRRLDAVLPAGSIETFEIENVTVP